MYSIHRHNILTIKEGRVSRDVVGANVYTSIDTGNTKTATTTCQYNDKYPITFGNRSINECQNRSIKRYLFTCLEQWKLVRL